MASLNYTLRSDTRRVAYAFKPLQRPAAFRPRLGALCAWLTYLGHHGQRPLALTGYGEHLGPGAGRTGGHGAPTS